MGATFTTYLRAAWQVVPTLAMISVMAIGLFTYVPSLPSFLLIAVVAGILVYRKREQFRVLKIVMARTFQQKQMKQKKTGQEKGNSQKNGNVIPFRRK